MPNYLLNTATCMMHNPKLYVTENIFLFGRNTKDLRSTAVYKEWEEKHPKAALELAYKLMEQ